MKRERKITQAYEKTPWRKQFQVIGLYLAVIFFIAIVASVYLEVTARATTYGRKIQGIRIDTRVIEKDIQDLSFVLARVTSIEELQKRGEKLKFELVDPNAAIFLIIPGYLGNQYFELAPEPHQLEGVNQPQLPYEYTVSLVDWIKNMIIQNDLNAELEKKP
jgi:hypothetical protein